MNNKNCGQGNMAHSSALLSYLLPCIFTRYGYMVVAEGVMETIIIAIVRLDVCHVLGIVHVVSLVLTIILLARVPLFSF